MALLDTICLFIGRVWLTVFALGLLWFAAELAYAVWINRKKQNDDDDFPPRIGWGF